MGAKDPLLTHETRSVGGGSFAPYQPRAQDDSEDEIVVRNPVIFERKLILMTTPSHEDTRGSSSSSRVATVELARGSDEPLACAALLPGRMFRAQFTLMAENAAATALYCVEPVP